MLDKPQRNEVAWMGNVDSPKHLYKRNTTTSYKWVRVCPTGNREKEYATFQSLRREGYVLMDREGNSLLNANGQVEGDKPLPAIKSTLSMDAIGASLEQIKLLDLTSIPEGENPITRLLTLSDRISLIRFNEALGQLPRETLIGYALQVTIKVQGYTGPHQLTNGLVTPSWMHSSMEIGDAELLGHLVISLARTDKPGILALLEKLLPEVVRLESLKTGQASPPDVTNPDPHWRDGAA